MKNIEDFLVEAAKTKLCLCSYFKIEALSYSILDADIKKRLNSSEDPYPTLIDFLKKNEKFESHIFIEIEKLIIKYKKHSDAKPRLETFIKYILQCDDNDLTLKDAYEHIRNVNEPSLKNKFEFFIIQLLYHCPKLFDNLKYDQRIVLKKIICTAFDSILGHERDDYHLLINKVSDYFNRTWDYLNREMLRYVKLKTFVDIKNNRPNLFSFLNNFKIPFLTNDDIQQRDRLVVAINSIIREHPESGDKNYYDYYNRVTADLEKLIYDFEKHITYFTSVTCLPILHLVDSALKDEHNLITESISCEINFVKPDKKYPLKSEEYFELEIPLYYHSGNSKANDVFIQITSHKNLFEIEPINQFCKYIDDSPHNRSYISKFKLKPILKLENETELDISISWKSNFGKNHVKHGRLVLKNIDSKINWGELREVKNPYSLNAKEDLEELFGRDSIITSLKRGLKGSQSFKLFGQRRVGKTSIAKSLYKFLLKTSDPSFESFIPAYLSIGQIATSNDILGDMGFFIADDLVENFQSKRAFQPIENKLNQANFSQSLTKLVGFIKNLFKSYPDIKIVIFIDEFDELPSSLYQGESGKNFFLALKSLTELNNISIITIGGEKLPIIFAYQGIRFNKINDIAVDYFDTQKNKENLKDIIIYPSIETEIDFSESALDTIIEYSAGNPYYIMLICSFCFDEILKKEISSVDRTDILKMIKDQIGIINIQHFQHFWEDGKIGTEEEEAWWSYYNSKILVIISQIAHKSGRVKYLHLKKIIQEDKEISEAYLDIYLEQLVRRKILVKNDENEYRIRVKLFEEWLALKGSEEINLLFKNTHYLRDAISTSKKYEYTEENIRHLEKKFGNYYKTISKEDIRNFLNQFKVLFGSKAAWYAYKVLENVRIYSRSDIERYFKELFEANILSDAKEISDIKEGTRKFGTVKEGPSLIKSVKYQNIIVSKIDPEGKSGSEMLRIFAMANNILDRNVMGSNEIRDYIEKNNNQNYIIIFVDDFIGTGDSAIANFDRFFNTMPNNFFEKHFIYYCVICAYNEGIHKLEASHDRKFRKIVAYENIDENSKVFSESSRVFPNSHERFEAKRIFQLIGQKLEKKHPLGYKDMQLNIIFWDNAPNDTLPALIKGGKIKLEKDVGPIEWEPIFPRR